jgi:hypothetical protein
MIEKFKIRDRITGQFIYVISANGDLVSSTLGSEYYSYAEALTYICNAQSMCTKAGFYVDVERLVIEEYRLCPYNITPVKNFQINSVMANPDLEENVNYVRVILKTCVSDGFMIVRPEFIEFILTYDKYQPILSELIPPHMLQSIEEFRSVGIKGCDLDTLGSISLTASTEQLKMYDIEGLIRSRENKISK